MRDQENLVVEYLRAVQKREESERLYREVKRRYKEATRPYKLALEEAHNEVKALERLLDVKKKDLKKLLKSEGAVLQDDVTETLFDKNEMVTYRIVSFDGEEIRDKKTKKRGPKPKVKEESNVVVERKKRGPKPKVKEESNVVVERKKPGPKPKIKEEITAVIERKKPGPKPKVKEETTAVVKHKKPRPKPKVKEETTTVVEHKKRGPKPKVKEETTTVVERKKPGPKPKIKVETLVAVEPKSGLAPENIMQIESKPEPVRVVSNEKPDPIIIKVGPGTTPLTEPQPAEKKKRVLSPEHLEKMRAGLAAKNANKPPKVEIPLEDRIAQNDLTIVEGIGEKTAAYLNKAGITRIQELAKMSPDDILKALESVGGRFPLTKTDTWPRQAFLASEGMLDELRELQSALIAGRKTK